MEVICNRKKHRKIETLSIYLNRKKRGIKFIIELNKIKIKLNHRMQLNQYKIHIFRLISTIIIVK